MNIEHLREQYPKIFKTLADDVTELRYLMVIDENYDDDDSDEFDGIDPEDFNLVGNNSPTLGSIQIALRR